MSLMSFSDFEYAGKRKQTRRQRFAEMDQVVPWSALLKLIEPSYPKAGGGRKPYPLDGSKTVDGCGRGAPVMWADGPEKARSLEKIMS